MKLRAGTRPSPPGDAGWRTATSTSSVRSSRPQRRGVATLRLREPTRAAQFFDDMARVTEHRADPDLVETLVVNVHPTLRLDGRRTASASRRRTGAGLQGRRQAPLLGRPHRRGRRGGPGLVEAERALAEKAGADIRLRAPARLVLVDDDGVHGSGPSSTVAPSSISRPCAWCWRAAVSKPSRVADALPRARVGPRQGARYHVQHRRRPSRWRWTPAPRPRGTGRDATPSRLDRNAPEFGDLAVGDGFQKHS